MSFLWMGTTTVTTRLPMGHHPLPSDPVRCHVNRLTQTTRRLHDDALQAGKMGSFQQEDHLAAPAPYTEDYRDYHHFEH